MYARSLALRLLHLRPAPSRALRCQLDPAALAPRCPPVRTYAIPGRPRSTVGEPTRTVKRSVKNAAGTAADASKSAAKQKNLEKEAKAKAKAKAAKAKKKELTPEQKARKAKALEKADIKELKKLALDPPLVAQSNAWTVFFTEKTRGHGMFGETKDAAEIRRKAAERTKEIAAAWKDISAPDREHYNHLANNAREESLAAYKRWVESHTAEEIHTANQARAKLRTKLKKDRIKSGKRSKWRAIDDERQTKRPVSAFAQFAVNRHASGDFKGIKLPETTALIAKEWKELSEGERKKYVSLFNEDAKRYQEEYQTLHGHSPQGYGNGAAQQITAAA